MSFKNIKTAEDLATEKAEQDAKAARREELTNLVRTPIGVLTLQSLAARLSALEELLGYQGD